MIFAFEDRLGPFKAGPNAPLARVAMTFLYPLQAKLATLPGVAPAQEVLSAEFPDMQPLTHNQAQLHLSLGAGSVPTTESVMSSEQRWIFRGSDRGYTVVIGPQSAEISIGRGYHSRRDFSAVVTQVCDAIAAASRPPYVTGITVRYVNAVMTEPNWTSHWNPSLLGWSVSDEVHALTRFSMSQTVLADGRIDLGDADALANVVVRSGIVPGVAADIADEAANKEHFVLDCEIGTPAQQPFAAIAIDRVYRSCATEIARFFTFALSESGRQHYGLKQKEE